MLRNPVVVEAEIDAITRRMYMATRNDAPQATRERLREERNALAQEWGELNGTRPVERRAVPRT